MHDQTGCVHINFKADFMGAKEKISTCRTSRMMAGVGMWGRDGGGGTGGGLEGMLLSVK